jgi:hypothetical protein
MSEMLKDRFARIAAAADDIDQGRTRAHRIRGPNRRPAIPNGALVRCNVSSVKASPAFVGCWAQESMEA